ncbi:MAG: ATP-binding protein [Dermatophilaceae bacterium]
MSRLIDELLARVRAADGDTTDIEVKSAAGGLPQNVTSTLCALANLPGGGWLVLGLDERAGFTAVELGDVQALKQGLAGKARGCLPPVQLTIEQDQVDGMTVVVARVAECAPSVKPCRIGPGGPAWVRAWDGDFTMSPLEEQAFLAQREQPRFDRLPVDGATMTDLDERLVELWSRTVTELDPRGLGRFTGREQLFRAGIVTVGDIPTKAGLLALGVHPQQFFPRYVVNLAVEPRPGSTGVRARELTTPSGPVPVMLEACMDWARKVFDRSVITDVDGRVADSWQYPLEAFRELVGNALVHRDLDAWSEGQAIEVRLRADRLVITSPGGLYGITVDRLGREGTTSARNARLIEVCKYTRSGDGARVVETLASGIPRVFETLRAARLPDPLFHDTGVSFTAVLRHPTHVATPGEVPTLGRSEQLAYDALVAGQLSVDELHAATGLQPATVRKALRSLRGKGLVTQYGGRGQLTTYARKEAS